MTYSDLDLETLRREMDLRWREATAEQSRSHSSFYAIGQIEWFYGILNEEGRDKAGQVIVGWIDSEDEGKRYDALWLVDSLDIDAMDALIRRRSQLLESPRPDSRELDRINKMISDQSGSE